MFSLLTTESESERVVIVSYPRERLSESFVVISLICGTVDNIRDSKGIVVCILASTPERCSVLS